jgi:thiamine-monophosphate kinase
MMGFEALRAGSGDSLAFRRPQALLAEGRALAPFVTAMMDVSDGLLLDASRMARASGATITIDSALVPIAAPEPRRQDALRWGDDYQLLFAMPASTTLPIPAHRIGTVLPGGDPPIVLDGLALWEDDGLGYEHR